MTPEYQQRLTELIARLVVAAEEIASAGMREHAGTAMEARRAIRELCTRILTPTPPAEEPPRET